MSVMPKPVIEPVHQPMYPTLPSLQEAIAFAQSEMPDIERNVLLRVFGVYHNTFIAVQSNQGVSP